MVSQLELPPWICLPLLVLALGLAFVLGLPPPISPPRVLLLSYRFSRLSIPAGQRRLAGISILHSSFANQVPPCSGIFGYVNYLVEKDRKFIIDTLINGTDQASLASPLLLSLLPWTIASFQMQLSLSSSSPTFPLVSLPPSTRASS